MDDYQLKKRFAAALDTEGSALARHLARARDALLDFERVDSYRDLRVTNPRLRALLADTTGRKAWQLLWLPPTLPNWRPEPPFADLAGLTKRLIFSRAPRSSSATPKAASPGCRCSACSIPA